MAVGAGLDTNVLVRHLTGDPPGQAARATRFLEEAEELLVPDVIVAELVYLLESFNEVAIPEVAEIVRSVVAFGAVRTVDPDLLLRALEVYEIHRVDFAEAYLVGCAEVSGVGEIVSFDRSKVGPPRSGSEWGKVPAGPERQRRSGR